MTPNPFTEEQITVLRENPNTEYVSESVIKFILVRFARQSHCLAANLTEGEMSRRKI